MAGVLVGCAGSGTTGGSSGGSGGGTSGLPATSIVSITGNEANYGHVDFGFLTGQGRGISNGRVASTFAGVVRRAELTDEIGLVINPLDPALTLPLVGFQFQTKSLNVPFVDAANNRLISRQFTSYDLDFLKFQNNGSDLSVPANFPFTIPTRIRALPGRSTMLPIYVDDAIFSIDPITGNVLFDSGIFNAVNRPDGKPIKSFLNDYVSFDLTGMNASDLPVMNDGVTPAGRVYFSGDNYAISEAGNSGNFEALTLDVTNPIMGLFGPPGSGGAGRPGHAGTFSLYTPNPTNPDPTVTMDIVALQGTWREYQSVLSNVSNFEIITFPSSDDNNLQEMVAFTRTNGVITNLYYGQANFAATATKGSFQLWPVKNLPSADISGEIDGELSNFLNKDAKATTSFIGTRYGSYTFTSGSLPAGFKSSGSFTVFRL